ncbi:hypothetical protein ALC60_01380 [Trachymyrmex zeteki]|uniref:Uncharacterized protein n=1 Tax=Mycetomoellerius zeteki TaxID=64791 RepID=A0A151XGR3_9HYME|nr:hypothetical protein ALC60_01380 [Trachymyrmex zeteki]
MGLMSFLIPHISHRKSRSSMGNQHLSTSSTLFKISSPAPLSFVSSKAYIIDDVENLLAQSTSALTNLATIVHKSISKRSPDKINE